MKKTTSKKILLGSAVAGLVLAGPGIFQTADLGAGYRMAHAEAENSYVGDKGSGQEQMEAKEKAIQDENAKKAAAERAEKKAHKEAAKGCGAGSCG